MNAIEIRNLSKNVDTFTLNIENLDIKKGFITGFIGPNGSGKTTTIKLIMNMLNKDNGTIKREIANKLAMDEYKKYRVIQDKKYISDFDELLIKTKNNIKENDKNE